MFRCIRCEKVFDDAERTDEHVFPESIGGTICIHDICKSCNSFFGSYVDGPFVNNVLIDSRRMMLGLAGKSGRVPNPLQNGVMADSPDQKVKLLLDDGASKRLYTVPSVQRSTDEKGNPIISIRLDKSDEDKLPQIIETLKSRFARDGKQVEFKTIDKQEFHVDKPWVKEEFHFDALGWQRGIIKIAYELAYRFLGPSYLDDPMAKELRQILLPEKISEEDFRNARFRANIGLASAQEQDFMFLDDPNSLYGALLHVNGTLLCAVKIFDVFQGKIVVTEHFPGKYPLEGEVIRINVVNQETIEMPYHDYLAHLFPDAPPNGT
jgi:hypothetical protein